MRTNTLLTLTICGFLVSPAQAMQRSDAMGPSELRILTMFIAIPAAYVAGTFAQYLAAPDAQRGVYLTCNENEQATTLERMCKLHARGNTGIGTSALFNLSLFLARHKQGVKDWILVDPAPEVQKFWLTLKDIFKRAANLEEAFETLEEAMLANPSDYFTDSFLRMRRVDTAHGYGRWLAMKLSQAKEELRVAQGKTPFDELKVLVSEHLLLIPTDLTSRDEVRVLAEYISARKMRLDTLYVSNINMVLNEHELQFYRSCVANLRWQSGVTKPAYLVEAGPSSFGENARELATESYQRIYDEWQVD